MKPAVQALLDSFDDLSDAEQYEVALEILRRAARPPVDNIPDEVLIAAADQLFRELDAREAADAGSSPPAPCQPSRLFAPFAPSR